MADHVLSEISDLLVAHAAKKLSMIQDDGGDGFQTKLAKRKLTQLGMLKYHSGVLNSAELQKKEVKSTSCGINSFYR